MNTFLASAAALVLAYLLGSVPFAVVVSRLFGLADPRSYGSKNPGATNVLRSGNKKAAICTLLGDLAKGFLAVYLARKIGLSQGWFDEGTVALVVLAVFLGHLYPVFLKFKGGKGVATAAGVLLAVDWRLGVIVLAVWLATAYLFRYSSLAALVAAIVAPLVAFFMLGMTETGLAVLILAVILVARHWANIQRLVAGKESKIGGNKLTDPAPGSSKKPRKNTKNT